MRNEDYDENRQGWLFNDERKEVTFVNNETALETLQSQGWQVTSPVYATYWLMDNGYKYVDKN